MGSRALTIVGSSARLCLSSGTDFAGATRRPSMVLHKTIYNRFIRWSRLGVFNKIFAELARKGRNPERVMIDATHLKAHRTAASLLKKGLFPDVLDAPKAA